MFDYNEFVHGPVINCRNAADDEHTSLCYSYCPVLEWCVPSYNSRALLAHDSKSVVWTLSMSGNILVGCVVFCSGFPMVSCLVSMHCP